MSRTAAIIGGGVIGAGWAARFLMNGWNVRVFDPSPDAARNIGEVLDNARRSLPGLSDVALPDEGTLSFSATISEAVANADWIQESVPERLATKQQAYCEIQATCPKGAVLASSTSGFKPSELQTSAARPGQIIVCHPFNPVYLLPLVEVVGGPNAEAAIVARAQDILVDLGMKPLLVRNEIDAHIADRLLEAVWREALWLVHDGVATTEEIDDAIRFGFGIRWAQMGLFETYRLAGGETGMAHFIRQFGPALAWPWSKLTDVPDLTDDLVKTIADQSDAQSGMHSIRALERIRDTNLVTVMRGLKGQNWGAGAVLNAHDMRLRSAEVETDFSQLILTLDRTVPLDWTDFNGHMNEARYLEASSKATDRFMELVGCDATYIANGGSYFTAETHIRHLNEAHAGDRLRVKTLLLNGTGKKLHVFNLIYAGDALAATVFHRSHHG